MAKKKYKRGGNINSTGYTEETATDKNLYNIIPNTSNITMESVDKNILGASYDASGRLTSMKFMKPEEEYQFPQSTEAVYEVPQYQMGKNEQSYRPGYLPQSNFQNPFTNTIVPTPIQQAPIQPQQSYRPGYLPQNGYQQLNSTNFQSTVVPSQQSVQSVTQPTVNTPQSNLDLPSAGNTPYESPTGERPQIESGIKSVTPAGIKDPMETMRENALATTTQFENTNGYGEASQQGFQNPQNDKYQFINPYSGFDLPSAAVMLGQGIESGNAFDIGVSGLKLATGLARNVVGGMGRENRRQNVMKNATENYRDSLTPAPYTARDGGYYQDGGQQAPPPSQEEVMQMVAQALQQGAQPEEIMQQLIQMGIPEDVVVQLVEGVMQGGQEQPQQFQEGGVAKELTGEYTQETENLEEEDSVAEIEKNEWLLNSETGKITKALGDSHEKGGIKVTAEQLPPNSLIISDHLKLGDNAKYYKDNFELEVKPKDTFAKVLDAFTKKSGLQKLNDEQEDYIKSLDKEIKKEKQDDTTKLNQKFLQSKIDDLEQKKQPLEKVRMNLFQDVFEKQEAGKKVEKETAEFQNGGTYNGDLVMEYANKYNIAPERAMEIVQEFQNGGRNIPQYQDGKGLLNPYASLQNIGKSGVPEGISEAEYFQNRAMQNSAGNVSGKAPTYTPEEKQLIKTHYAKFIKDPQSLQTLVSAVDNNELVFNPGMLETVKTGKVLPIELQHRDGSGTYGSQDEARINGYLYKDTFKQKTGRDFDPNNPEDTKLIYNEVIPQLKTKGVDYNGAPFRGQKTDAYGNIIASEPGFVLRGKAKKDGEIDLDKYRNQTAGAKQLIADEYGITVDDLENYAKNSTDKFLKLKKDTPIQATPSVPPTEGVPQNPVEEQPLQAEEAIKYPRTGLLLLPDQTPLSPQSLQPALKLDRRYDRVEAMQVTPEASIAEIRKQEQAAIDSYSSLPDSQRASAIAQVQSNTQDKIAQISAQAQGQNVASKLQADTTNAGIQMQEENARGTDLMSYEQRIQTASDKTFQDINRYYNTLQKNNVGNFNTVNNVNLLNAMYDNYQFTGDGVQQVGENPYLNYDNSATQPLQPQTEAEKKKAQKRNVGKRKTNV